MKYLAAELKRSGTTWRTVNVRFEQELQPLTKTSLMMLDNRGMSKEHTWLILNQYFTHKETHYAYSSNPRHQV